MPSLIYFFILLLGGVNLAFLVGWHCEIPFIVSLPPSHWPIPYGSAVCLVLSALALLALFSSSRAHFAPVFGCPILFIGLQRVAELLFPQSTFWLLDSLLIFPHHSPRLTLGAALAFIMIGALFVFCRPKKKNVLRAILLLFFSTALIFMGSIQIFVDLTTALNPELHWSLTHFYTAIGLLFIGFLFLSLRFRVLEPKPKV